MLEEDNTKFVFASEYAERSFSANVFVLPLERVSFFICPELFVP